MSNLKWLTILAAAVIALLAVSSLAFATEASTPATPAVSKEMREKMATVHERMAACLRSEKSLEDCHHEMMKSGESMHGHDCPMMGQHENMSHGHDHEADSATIK